MTTISNDSWPLSRNTIWPWTRKTFLELKKHQVIGIYHQKWCHDAGSWATEVPNGITSLWKHVHPLLPIGGIFLNKIHLLMYLLFLCPVPTSKFFKIWKGTSLILPFLLWILLSVHVSNLNKFDHTRYLLHILHKYFYTSEIYFNSKLKQNKTSYPENVACLSFFMWKSIDKSMPILRFLKKFNLLTLNFKKGFLLCCKKMVIPLLVGPEFFHNSYDYKIANYMTFFQIDIIWYIYIYIVEFK